MRGYKEPGFNERAAAANSAKAKALEALKNKPPIDEAEMARRAAAQQAKEAAAAAKREAAQLAKEQARLEREQREREAAEAAEAAKPKVRTEAELKAARDARYAARKKRKS